jgi:hypothetical protein
MKLALLIAVAAIGLTSCGGRAVETTGNFSDPLAVGDFGVAGENAVPDAASVGPIDASAACASNAGSGTTCTLCENLWHCPNQAPAGGGPLIIYPQCPEDVANGSSLDEPCGDADDCIACQDPDMFHVSNAAWLWTCNGPDAPNPGWQGVTLTGGGAFTTCTPP